MIQDFVLRSEHMWLCLTMKVWKIIWGGTHAKTLLTGPHHTLRYYELQLPGQEGESWLFQVKVFCLLLCFVEREVEAPISGSLAAWSQSWCPFPFTPTLRLEVSEGGLLLWPRPHLLLLLWICSASTKVYKKVFLQKWVDWIGNCFYHQALTAITTLLAILLWRIGGFYWDSK